MRLERPRAPRVDRERAIPLGLTVAAFALALAQRPGEASSDTKIDLQVDPTGFLADVASVWTPTGSLGHVQGGQYGGYLWPMGPFFSLLHSVGLSPWLVQRLWLGLVLALAAWGTVRLLDALGGRPRGALHLVAGAAMLLNPYVVVFANRTSVTLLGYAALPWLLLAVHRGVRQHRSRWWWPAAFALILTSTGGGVNAAVTAWILIGPVLLLLYEPLWGGVSWSDARAFAWRAALASAAASAWWVGPVLMQARFGLDFLQFTEQTGTIWGTTSLTESLRLMGYWISYLGVGYGDSLRPYFSDSPTLLFDPVVVVAGLLVPALALGGFAWTRRWRYGPFFLTLTLVGILVMSVGFPEGVPLRRAATFAYNHFSPVQFLRTTYKAGPLVALGLACLGGGAAATLWAWLRGLEARRLRVAATGAAALAGVSLLALAAWPMTRGDAVDAEVTWDEIPSAWEAVAGDLDRELPANERALVLPGQAFGFYAWGGTIDPILPALTDAPVAVRNVPPYADLHAVDLLWTVDLMVQQQRLVAGQLVPLLDLMAVGAVVSATDDDVDRSGGMPPAEAARALSAQPALERPEASYGRAREFDAPAAESADPPVSLPEVRRYDLEPGAGVVRVLPRAPATVVDGSAQGLAGLAAFGGLPSDAPLFYAGDRSAQELRDAAAEGGDFVITDSNRRRVFVASRSRQTFGATLGPADPISEDAAGFDLFPARGTDAQTVAELEGARYVRAPFSPGFAQFPEERPHAAFDGSRDTRWAADPTLDDDRHWIEVGFEESRDVDYVDLLPTEDRRTRVTEVEVAGRTYPVRPGWNRLELGLRGVSSLRVEIAGTDPPPDESESAGGFDEIRVPGLEVEERLRPPVLVERALAGADLDTTSLSYVFERTTGDDPTRAPVPRPPPSGRVRDRNEAEAELIRAAEDGERTIERVLSPPTTRRWTVDGWVTVGADAPDPALDRVAGTSSAGVRFGSSGRFDGRPGFRASGAFDGRGGRDWVDRSSTGDPAWVGWRTRGPTTLRELEIAPPAPPASAPTRVRVVTERDRSPAVEVGTDGGVELPRPLRGERFRVEVLEAAADTSDASSPAVGIGHLSGRGVPRAAGASPDRVEADCGAVTGRVGDRSVELRAEGDRAAFDAGLPLRARGCGSPLELAEGRQELTIEPRLLRPLSVRLRSRAPGAAPAPPAPAGAVLSAGRVSGRGSDDVEIEVDRPAWLVLGQSYNRGWRASCDGRSLGAPNVIEGFANGWPIEPGCRSVTFDFGPQRAVDIGYAVGALACLGLLVVLLARRPQRLPFPWPAPAPFPERRSRPLPLGRAIALALGVAAVASFVFSIRAGVVAGPVVGLILWRGVGPHVLALSAGALLAIVVPALYLAFPGDDRGGYDPRYAIEHLGAHWVAVGAVVLLIVALWRTLARARGGSDAPNEPGVDRRTPVAARVP